MSAPVFIYIMIAIPWLLAPAPATVKSTFCTSFTASPFFALIITAIDAGVDPLPGASAYTMFPALTKSIMPGFELGMEVDCSRSPEAGSTSTKWFTPTSVTNTVFVHLEKVAQQVAFDP